jgi:hypothetical protein
MRTIPTHRFLTLCALLFLLATTGLTTAADAQSFGLRVTFSNTDNVVDMGSVKEWFCGLTFVSGSFSDSGRSVKIEQVKGRWKLNTTDRISVRAACYYHGGAAEVGSTTAWKQGEDPKFLANTKGIFCALTGMQGKFSGGDQKVAVVRVGEEWILTGSSSGHGVNATGTCVSLSWQGLVDKSWKQGDPSVKLGSAGPMSCLLSAITGRFRGGGEEVEVSLAGNEWILSGDSQQNDVGATATCAVLPPLG